MKKNNFVKIILIIFAIALVVAIAAMLMPVAFVGGLGAVWYFTKKKPDSNKRNISIAFAVVGLLGSIFITPAMLNNQKNTSTTVATAPSSTSSTETSTSTSSTTEASSSTEESTEPTTKNDGPEYTEESNAAFATAFMNALNQSLADNGVDINVRVQYYGKNLIHVIVPQDFKYEPNTSIQKVADSVFQAKENYFTEWAIDNGYDLGYTYAPKLYINAEDDTTLAEEEGILERKMELKIDNN
ncbi:hypothetical protein HCB74_06255 [Streptococcus suis]|nr:hypothetical protein [Streptococcus suis]